MTYVTGFNVGKLEFILNRMKNLLSYLTHSWRPVRNYAVLYVQHSTLSWSLQPPNTEVSNNSKSDKQYPQMDMWDENEETIWNWRTGPWSGEHTRLPLLIAETANRYLIHPVFRGRALYKVPGKHVSTWKFAVILEGSFPHAYLDGVAGQGCQGACRLRWTEFCGHQNQA
ncbi:hypothetical protein BC629DRAFT_1446565 [Irpex lacteus]|nr:hypothetical protein BC629DRAFT_1446565 [Irpex lacteus]